jgi:ectoine hydroxylase-related dioxygenase (phytanoyl-CoA dioxygenase family)
MIVERSVESFKVLLGLDLHIQKYPYVRISRPKKYQDNIGIHRDTHYGCSPYEVSVSIPFTTVPAKGSLGVLSGTHLLAEDALPFEQVKSPNVEKNSTKHKLGFLYAPKVMSDEVRQSIKPIALKVGQALAFSLSLVHGQEINQSKGTRISTDVRLVNSFAPIQWSRNVHSDYYEPFCSSVVTQQAKIYVAANNCSENKAIKL